MAVDDVGRAYLIDSVKPLHPEEQTVAEMLQGWRNQQLSRNLQFETIYTCVSSDYRTRTLRNALDATIAAALGKTQDGGTA